MRRLTLFSPKYFEWTFVSELLLALNLRSMKSASALFKCLVDEEMCGYFDPLMDFELDVFFFWASCTLLFEMLEGTLRNFLPCPTVFDEFQMGV
jgi:hypothetical protein